MSAKQLSIWFILSELYHSKYACVVFLSHRVVSKKVVGRNLLIAANLIRFGLIPNYRLVVDKSDIDVKNIFQELVISWTKHTSFDI